MENSEWNLFSDELKGSNVSSRFEDYNFESPEEEVKIPSQELLIPSGSKIPKKEIKEEVDVRLAVEEEILILVSVLDNFVPQSFLDHYTLLQTLSDCLGYFDERGWFCESWRANGKVYPGLVSRVELYK